MKMLLIKILLLSSCVFAIQMFIGDYYQRKSATIGFSAIKNLRELYGKKIGVCYFGDSVLRYTDASDVDKTSIPKKLEKELDEPVHSLDGGAFQSDVFEAMMQTLVANGAHPKAVLVPINMRSFSVSWDRLPAWQFEKAKLLLLGEKSFLVRTFSRPLQIFKAIRLTPILSKDYWDTPVDVDGKIEGSMKYIQDTYLSSTDGQVKLTWHLKLHYLLKLDKDHRKLRSMKNLSSLLQREKIPVCFYIVPLDVETGKATLGDAFSRRLGENILVIRNILAEQGHELHDLSALLPTSCFSYPTNVPNEHLNQEGRSRMASALAQLLRTGKCE